MDGARTDALSASVDRHGRRSTPASRSNAPAAATCGPRLRLITTFLHRGGAHSIADTIAAHDGQGRAARNSFLTLDPAERAQLLAFLAGL